MTSLDYRHRRLKKRQDYYKKKLEKSFSLRLILGIASLVLILLSTSSQAGLIFTGLFFLFLTAFVFFVLKSRKIKSHLKDLDTWINYHNRQLQRLSGKAPQDTFYTPQDLSFDEQNYAQDLILFGKKSIFSLVDETVSMQAQKNLSAEFLKPKKTTSDIHQQQKRVEYLSKRTWIYERIIIKTQGEKINPIHSFLETFEKPLLLEKFNLFAIAHAVLFIANWTNIVLFSTGQSSLHPLIGLVASLLLNLWSQQSFKSGFEQGNSFLSFVLQLGNAISEVEKVSVERLDDKKYFSQSRKLPIGTQLKKLERIVSFLSTRGHPLVHIGLLTLFPWDFTGTFFLERWRQKFYSYLPIFINELEALEQDSIRALIYKYHSTSLANLREENTISAKKIRHPLLKKEDAISNDIKFDNYSLLLLSGSNMSGKSTFMRTLAVNQLFAITGFPVFSEKMITYNAPIASCLHIKDSLDQGYSTFYFEVRKIKQMIEEAQSGRPFLYLVDEIFRGTNNHERLAGSKAVILELIKHPQVKGIISTHDLELTSLENKNPPIKNFHFGDSYINEELIFNYKLTPGPSPSTNALKIMKKEGLPV